MNICYLDFLKNKVKKLTLGPGSRLSKSINGLISLAPDDLIRGDKMLVLAMSITEDLSAYYTNKFDCRVVKYIHVGLFWREDIC
jgi:hypothetical protein